MLNKPDTERVPWYINIMITSQCYHSNGTLLKVCHLNCIIMCSDVAFKDHSLIVLTVVDDFKQVKSLLLI